MKANQIYFEMLYPPQNLFQYVPHPLTWLLLSKNEILSGTSLMRGLIPVTLFKRNRKDAVEYLASALLIRSTDNANNLTLHMDRLFLFSEKKERTEIFNIFLDEILHLADLMKVNRIEVEVYTELNEPISFPSGASYLDSWNASDLPDLFREYGFVSEEEKYCLVNNLSNKRFSSVNEVKAINSNQTQQHIRLNHTGRHLIKHTRKILFGPRSLASRNVAALSDPRLTLVTETKRFFHKQVSGVINWSPNIYPVLKTVGKRALYHDLNTLLTNPGGVKIGKIFNIMIDTRHFEVYKELCFGAMEHMKALGLSICHIGNISETEYDFLHFLRQEDFTNAQVIQLFTHPAHKT